jgi:hypothetical protein
VPVNVTSISYHGWANCYRLTSAGLEAIVVPAVGRIMQLRRVGDEAGTLWENCELYGQMPKPNSGTWANFGGDKCWPAPQSDWPKVFGHDWPPPASFDASAFEASVTDSGLMLKSPVDPAWGIQVVRQIELDGAWPVMRVRSEFHKMSGHAVCVAVWTIVQFSEPECVAIEVLDKSRFPGGYTNLIKDNPAELEVRGRFLTFVRHPHKSMKVGSDAQSIVWAGPASVVRMQSESQPGEYPDGGCHVEAYTNPGEQRYVELETLGPLVNLEVGQTAQHVTTYTMLPRTTADAREDARSAF